MNSRQTLRFWHTRIKLCVVAICFSLSPYALAAEPLAGPIAGGIWWNHLKQPDQSKSNPQSERFFNADIPLPIPMGISMPFMTFRYRDSRDSMTSQFAQDERFGIGFLHHAAEGDPAWRAEFSRLGKLNGQPALNTRLIANLIKPFPGLKLRPSDQVLSWIGMNYLHREYDHSPLIIPEFSWYRQGSEGLVIDINAPRHIYIGLSGGIFAATVGLEQAWLHWQGPSQQSSWVLRRTSRANIALTPISDWTLTMGVIHDLKSEQLKDHLGFELSLRWAPGP